MGSLVRYTTRIIPLTTLQCFLRLLASLISDHVSCREKPCICINVRVCWRLDRSTVSPMAAQHKEYFLKTETWCSLCTSFFYNEPERHPSDGIQVASMLFRVQKRKICLTVVKYAPLLVCPISQAHRGGSDQRPISLSDDPSRGI